MNTTEFLVVLCTCPTAGAKTYLEWIESSTR